ncbi:MAG: methyltransferase, partial [Candidatus Omnitrophota bacterium]
GLTDKLVDMSKKENWGAVNLPQRVRKAMVDEVKEILVKQNARAFSVYPDREKGSILAQAVSFAEEEKDVFKALAENKDAYLLRAAVSVLFERNRPALTHLVGSRRTTDFFARLTALSQGEGQRKGSSSSLKRKKKDKRVSGKGAAGKNRKSNAQTQPARGDKNAADKSGNKKWQFDEKLPDKVCSFVLAAVVPDLLEGHRKNLSRIVGENGAARILNLAGDKIKAEGCNIDSEMNRRIEQDFSGQAVNLLPETEKSAFTVFSQEETGSILAFLSAAVKESGYSLEILADNKDNWFLRAAVSEITKRYKESLAPAISVGAYDMLAEQAVDFSANASTWQFNTSLPAAVKAFMVERGVGIIIDQLCAGYARLAVRPDRIAAVKTETVAAAKQENWALKSIHDKTKACAAKAVAADIVGRLDRIFPAAVKVLGRGALIREVGAVIFTDKAAGHVNQLEAGLILRAVRAEAAKLQDSYPALIESVGLGIVKRQVRDLLSRGDAYEEGQDAGAVISARFVNETAQRLERRFPAAMAVVGEAEFAAAISGLLSDKNGAAHIRAVISDFVPMAAKMKVQRLVYRGAVAVLGESKVETDIAALLSQDEWQEKLVAYERNLAANALARLENDFYQYRRALKEKKCEATRLLKKHGSWEKLEAALGELSATVGLIGVYPVVGDKVKLVHFTAYETYAAELTLVVCQPFVDITGHQAAIIEKLLSPAVKPFLEQFEEDENPFGVLLNADEGEYASAQAKEAEHDKLTRDFGSILEEAIEQNSIRDEKKALSDSRKRAWDKFFAVVEAIPHAKDHFRSWWAVHAVFEAIGDDLGLVVFDFRGREKSDLNLRAVSLVVENVFPLFEGRTMHPTLEDFGRRHITRKILIMDKKGESLFGAEVRNNTVINWPRVYDRIALALSQGESYTLGLERHRNRYFIYQDEARQRAYVVVVDFSPKKTTRNGIMTIDEFDAQKVGGYVLSLTLEGESIVRIKEILAGRSRLYPEPKPWVQDLARGAVSRRIYLRPETRRVIVVNTQPRHEYENYAFEIDGRGRVDQVDEDNKSAIIDLTDYFKPGAGSSSSVDLTKNSGRQQEAVDLTAAWTDMMGNNLDPEIIAVFIHRLKLLVERIGKKEGFVAKKTVRIDLPAIDKIKREKPFRGLSLVQIAADAGLLVKFNAKLLAAGIGVIMVLSNGGIQFVAPAHEESILKVICEEVKYLLKQKYPPPAAMLRGAWDRQRYVKYFKRVIEILQERFDIIIILSKHQGWVFKAAEELGWPVDTLRNKIAKHKLVRFARTLPYYGNPPVKQKQVKKDRKQTKDNKSRKTATKGSPERIFGKGKGQKNVGENKKLSGALVSSAVDVEEAYRQILPGGIPTVEDMLVDWDDIFKEVDRDLAIHNVFYNRDTASFLAQRIPLDKGDKVLDFGTGTGVIACYLAKKGAGSVYVVALDIDMDSVRHAEANAIRMNLEQYIRVIRSDGYAWLREGERFNKIVFHGVPYTDNAEETDVALRDYKGKSIKTFLSGAPSRLLNRGTMILLYPDNPSSVERVKRLGLESGLIVTKRIKCGSDKHLEYLYDKGSVWCSDGFDVGAIKENMVKDGWFPWSIFTLTRIEDVERIGGYRHTASSSLGKGSKDKINIAQEKIHFSTNTVKILEALIRGDRQNIKKANALAAHLINLLRECPNEFRDEDVARFIYIYLKLKVVYEILPRDKKTLKRWQAFMEAGPITRLILQLSKLKVEKGVIVDSLFQIAAEYVSQGKKDFASVCHAVLESYQPGCLKDRLRPVNKGSSSLKGGAERLSLSAKLYWIEVMLSDNDLSVKRRARKIIMELRRDLIKYSELYTREEKEEFIGKYLEWMFQGLLEKRVSSKGIMSLVLSARIWRQSYIIRHSLVYIDKRFILTAICEMADTYIYPKHSNAIAYYLYKILLSITPFYPAALRRVAYMFIAIGKYEEAQGYIDSAVGGEDKALPDSIAQAILYLEKGEREKTVETLIATKEMFSDCFVINMYLAHLTDGAVCEQSYETVSALLKHKIYRDLLKAVRFHIDGYYGQV